MIMPIFQKPFARQTSRTLALTLALFVTATAVTISSAEALPSRQYVQEVTSALPAGTNLANAPAPAFQEAVQRVVLAHPASEAPTIAGALAKAAPMERAKEIAEAIGKLFPNHPGLAAHVVDIAREMTIVLNRKLGVNPTATSGDSKGVVEFDHKGIVEPESDITPDACATEIGSIAAILGYYIDPSTPAGQALVTQMIQAVVLVNPRLDFTAKVVEIFFATFRSLGVPDDLIDQLERSILDVIDDPNVREQIRQTLKRLKNDEVMFPPGYIIRHETPVTNG